MELRHMTVLYFSPSGTTEQTARAIADASGLPCDMVDLLRQRDYATHFAPDELVLVCLPVFGGRLPAVCPALLRQFTAEGSPAAGVVVYGNRAYEDAGVELLDLLTAQGFRPCAAAAVVAQHSIFPKVAAGRPAGTDLEQLARFGRELHTRLASLPAGELPEIPDMPGNRPYREFSGVPMRPRTSSSCIRCGACAAICPVGAIPAGDPTRTDKQTCISCTACIHVCPAGARSFGGLVYKIASVLFARKCALPRQPEFYLPAGRSE